VHSHGVILEFALFGRWLFAALTVRSPIWH